MSKLRHLTYFRILEFTFT